MKEQLRAEQKIDKNRISIAFSKILPHSKTKNIKKLLVFGENDSRCLSTFFNSYFLKA